MSRGVGLARNGGNNFPNIIKLPSVTMALCGQKDKSKGFPSPALNLSSLSRKYKFICLINQ